MAVSQLPTPAAEPDAGDRSLSGSPQTLESSPLALRQRLLAAGLWSTVSRGLGIAATLAINMWLARLLPPAEFGQYLLLMSLVTFAALVAMGGVNRAVVRLISESLAVGNRARIWQTLRWAMVITGSASLIVAGLTVVGLWGGSAWLFQTAFSPALIALVAGLVVLIALHQVAAEVLRGFHEARFSNLLAGQVGGPLVQGLFLALLVTLAGVGKLSLLLVVAANLLALVLLVPVVVRSLRRTIAWEKSSDRWSLAKRVESSVSRATTGRCFSPKADDTLPRLTAGYISMLCWPMWLAQCFAFATSGCDVWIAGACLSPEELALFATARRLMLLVAVALLLVNRTVISTISELFTQGRLAELQRVLRVAATLAAVPSLLILVSLVCFPATALEWLFGNYYRAAAVPLTIMACGQMVNTWSGACGLTLMMTGHERLVLVVNGVTTVLLFSLGPWAAWSFGMVGLATISATVLAVRNVVLWIGARRLLGVWTHVPLRFWSLLQRASASNPKSEIPNPKSNADS